MEDHGAFSRNAEGKYVIDVEKSKEALKTWSAMILEIEGEGDYDRAKAYAAENGVVRPSLQKDLDVIAGANIPVDILCVQGAEVLGL